MLGLNSWLRADLRPEGLGANAQGRSSSCPGDFPGLEEDSYLKLRSGLLREFKSMLKCNRKVRQIVVYLY